MTEAEKQLVATGYTGRKKRGKTFPKCINCRVRDTTAGCSYRFCNKGCAARWAISLAQTRRWSEATATWTDQSEAAIEVAFNGAVPDAASDEAE